MGLEMSCFVFQIAEPTGECLRFIPAVTVYRPDGIPASLYASPRGTYPLANPLQPDSQGTVRFYAPLERVNLRMSEPSRGCSWVQGLTTTVHRVEFEPRTSRARTLYSLAQGEESLTDLMPLDQKNPWPGVAEIDLEGLYEGDLIRYRGDWELFHSTNVGPGYILFLDFQGVELFSDSPRYEYIEGWLRVEVEAELKIGLAARTATGVVRWRWSRTEEVSPLSINDVSRSRFFEKTGFTWSGSGAFVVSSKNRESGCEQFAGRCRYLNVELIHV